ncbi:DUF202 domain-containing protein [Brachybacterium sp. DNPG3]
MSDEDPRAGEAGAEPAVFDPGLQPERTLLAWRRTCLSFGVASVVGMRFALESLGVIAVVIGVIGAGLAVLSYALTAIGYSRATHSLHAEGRLGRDGMPVLLATAAVLVIGAMCALVVLRGIPQVL